MRIERFAYKDLESGWELADTPFDAINLLVGISGVGKTRIIEALRAVATVAIDRPERVPHAAWTWQFSSEGVGYRWDVETAPGTNGSRGKRVFARERISLAGDTLIERASSGLSFAGRHFPKLDPTTSAVDLLSGEERVAPIVRAMELVIFSLFSGGHREPSSAFEVPQTWDPVDDLILGVKERVASRPRLEVPMGPDRAVVSKNVFVFDLFLMQEAYPEQFIALRDQFCEVFPTVTDVRVLRDGQRGLFSLEIRESSGAWIPQARISSGMLKTLVYLYEFDTAPASSVVIIDEFESSLGLNCLPAMTDALRARGDCQFIVTSHHPYVINNIPIEHWKLVERVGGAVTVTPAREIPALRAASHHEAFLRLINAERYAHGIR